MKKTTKLKLFNLWPPFLGAGIYIKDISDDMRHLKVVLYQWPWNKNLNGTHYGGSIFSMTDPFYAAMISAGLGPEYIVWDKAADIRFKKPGQGTLTAIYNINAQQIEDIRNEIALHGKSEPSFQVHVKDKHGDVVAEVNKVVHVRRLKDAAP